jgi:hypothetical protein
MLELACVPLSRPPLGKGGLPSSFHLAGYSRVSLLRALLNVLIVEDEVIRGKG